MGFRVAVVGATGNVGQEILSILAERRFPVDEIYALASEASVGKQISFGEDRVLDILPLKSFDFSRVDLVLSSPGAKVAAEFTPAAVAAGAIVIDNSSHFRMDPDVPLIVPEINPDALGGYTKRNIIANPNCSTIQLVMALAPLHRISPITRVVVATYQSVSGAGKAAMDELFNQTRGIYMNQSPENHELPARIAFNVVPMIDHMMDDGSTKEEWKMMAETKKILDPRIKVSATAVRVPVFIGHGAAVHVEFADPIEPKEAIRALRKQPGVVYLSGDDGEAFATPCDAAGEDAVIISRLRADSTVDHGLCFWSVTDNLRKGAALNAVQIAELLATRHLGFTPSDDAAKV